MSIYSFVRKAGCCFLAKFVFPTKVCGGAPKIPDGPVVLCANHLSFVDVVFLIARTERPIRFMAKKELFEVPLLGRFLKAMGAFPVNRGTLDVNAVKTGILSLSDGGILGIFPQGTRCAGVSPDQTYGKLYNGAAMMAHRAKAAILPVAITTKDFKVRPFKKVLLTYGKPIPYEEYSDFKEDGRNSHAVVMRYVFGRICAMAAQQIENDRKTD